MSKYDQLSCRVWSRFERKSKDGTVIKFRIQDAPNSLLDDVIEFNIKYFTVDESFQKAAGVSLNPASLEEYRNLTKKFAHIWSIVVCCEDNSDTIDKILGVSAVALETGEEMEDFSTKEMLNLFNIIAETQKLIKEYTKEFSVFHEGRGIIVHPDYRGLGIATEFIKIRRLAINEQNIPMTSAWMTSYGSQKAAERDNWETIVEVNVEDFGRRCGVVFKDAPLTFKFMAARASKDLSDNIQIQSKLKLIK